ncbi:MAG: hypothetical protein M5U28_13910 [Sandaracinaceae bacterium]|nr:hypothetical protein [Sandaracinaceae bacterium]
MRVILKLTNGRTVTLRPGPTQAEASCACPECGGSLAVRGDGPQVSDCDRYYFARGYCVACGKHVGEIRAYPSTIFGIAEDERVLRSGVRVY